MDGQLVNFPPGTRFERFGNPDGGREGRAILLDGQVWCWQSKYQWSFESSAGLNESYERAFSLEPHMTRYLVGMPIDLPAGDTERARSAQTKWIDWVIQKTSELPEGRSMEFEFHGENAFNLALLRPGNVGYLRYWFDRDSFAPSDFERLYGRARDIAGPRYTEELNVGVPLADVIRAFAGDAGALDSMLAALGQLRARAIAEVHFEDDPHRDELTELSVRVVGATTHLDQAVVEALETVAARRQPSSLDGAINAA
ncbi:MAG TPA: hypothetical protein VL068_05460, partial [Microthrixaceae bacterium]|nr:hypothetical protein [Microthrixaceae bacterium]